MRPKRAFVGHFEDERRFSRHTMTIPMINWYLQISENKAGAIMNPAPAHSKTTSTQRALTLPRPHSDIDAAIGRSRYVVVNMASHASHLQP